MAGAAAESAVKMHMQHTIVAQVIRAIGDAEFMAVTAQSICQHLEFELVAIVSHRLNGKPLLMFDNFDVTGGRRGLENYIEATHAVNPILELATRREGAFRARDFVIRAGKIGALAPYVVRSADEELGFRTVGWPERLEEIGLYFKAMSAIIEVSLYRPRGRRPADRDSLQKLEELRPALAAAFNKHATLAPGELAQVLVSQSLLTPRETEITELLLRGCDTRNIALRLAISRHTVKDHRKQIFRKLGIGTLAQLFCLFRQRTQ